MPVRAGVLTISDMGSRGEREDTSGAAIHDLLAGAGIEVIKYEIVPDEVDAISARLVDWADGAGLDLIITTGGTGLGRRDVTPEATRTVLTYEVPGIAEAMRQEGLKQTPMSMLSRAVTGVRGRTLIINLPGSPKGARENLSVVLPVLEHAVALLSGGPAGH